MSVITVKFTPTGHVRTDATGARSVFTGDRWIPYPRTAELLSKLAVENGWSVAEETPKVRVDRNGDVYVRVYAQRGQDAIHVQWFANPSKWCEAKVSRRINGKWHTVSTIKQIKDDIRETP